MKSFNEIMSLVRMVTRKPETYHYELNCSVIIPPKNTHRPNCNHLIKNKILIHNQIGYYKENNHLHCACCGDLIKLGEKK